MKLFPESEVKEHQHLWTILLKTQWLKKNLNKNGATGKGMILIAANDTTIFAIKTNAKLLNQLLKIIDTVDT